MGLLPTQTLLRQVSVWVQALPSSQAVPSVAGPHRPVAVLQVWHCGQGIAAEQGAARRSRGSRTTPPIGLTAAVALAVGLRVGSALAALLTAQFPGVLATGLATRTLLSGGDARFAVSLIALVLAPFGLGVPMLMVRLVAVRFAPTGGHEIVGCGGEQTDTWQTGQEAKHPPPR